MTINVKNKFLLAKFEIDQPLTFLFKYKDLI